MDEHLDRALASTRRVLANVRPAQYDDPTPCAEWDVRTLVNHTIGATGWYAASVRLGVSPPVGDQRFTDGDVMKAYDEGVAACAEAFGAPDAMDKLVKLPFAELPGSIVAHLLAREVFTHGWDLARATGQSTDLDPELAERLLELARATFPNQIRGAEGHAPFGQEAAAPPGATAADRLAAFLGRRG